MRFNFLSSEWPVQFGIVILYPMKLFLLSGGVFAFLSVALGAFAAHALKTRLDDYSMSVFRTGVEYQFFHALALIAIGVLSERFRTLQSVGYFFIVGIFLFSGSLYILALTGIKGFGAVTPLGGICFLTGWALFVWRVLRS